MCPPLFFFSNKRTVPDCGDCPFFLGAPCMITNLTVEVHCAGVDSDQLLAAGKGVLREGNPKEAGGKVPV
jgi:hypothetical protein